MMTSWNRNISLVTGPFWGESTRDRVDSPHKSQWRRVLIFLRVPEQTVEHTIETPLISYAMALIVTTL